MHFCNDWTQKAGEVIRSVLLLGKGKEEKGKKRKGTERKRKEEKGKEKKGKERKGKEVIRSVLLLGG